MFTPAPLRRLLALLLVAAGASALRAEELVLRVGFFPNITHAQGVIGSETTREGHGWFEQRLGPGVSVHWFAFNAGPSAMEALFANSIDLTYVGPSPALNAYVRSAGDEVRILAGSAEGGAALVVAADGPIHQAADFKGRRIATPQLGNTQDIAARCWLKRQGFKVTLTGGDVTVLPIANAEQLPLFKRGYVDAVWTVEPWVSRLVKDGGGRVYLEQKDAVATILVASAAFLKFHPDLAARFRAAHVELTAWVNANPAKAQKLVADGLGAATGRKTPVASVAAAWGRVRFTDTVVPAQLTALVADAQSVGFLRDAIPLDLLFPRVP
jgi:NitT/TauT family transport system substrate-binding protein